MAQKMKLVAIDLGKYMGLYDGKTPCTIFLGDPPKKFDAPYRPYRMAKWVLELNAYLLEAQPDVVAYERPFGRGLDATRSGWGYAGIIEAYTTIHGAALLDPQNNTVRKWATGSGKKAGSKQPMIDAAERLSGLKLDEHSADAVCIWHYTNEMMVTG
jgi:Holliday junction resolvasome RuvABC endonuclease subunit